MAFCKEHRGVDAEVSEKETVLLGLLAEEPSHAYGIEEKIRTRQMEHWTPIGFSSIYRLLKGLEERGFIVGRSEQGGQGASRKVYELTEGGRRALAEGVLACLLSMNPMRAPFSAGLANLSRAPFARTLKSLKLRRQRMAGLREELDALEREHTGHVGEVEDEAAQRRYRLTLTLVFEHARQHMLAEDRFLEKAIEVVAASGEDIFPPAQLLGSEGRAEKEEGKR